MNDDVKRAMAFVPHAFKADHAALWDNLRILAAHIDVEPARLAAAREEQHSADLRAAMRSLGGACRVCADNAMLAVDSTLGGIVLCAVCVAVLTRAVVMTMNDNGGE